MPVEYYQDSKGDWRWRLKGANGEIVAQGEGHSSEHDARRAFDTMVHQAVAEAAEEAQKD